MSDRATPQDANQADGAAHRGYALVDVGDGRRLERFGDMLVDRPAPAADRLPRAEPGAWDDPDARFDRPNAAAAGAEGGWWVRPGVPRTWTIELDGSRFELRCAAGGQVGLFPEHVSVVRSMAGLVPTDASTGVLNLFAYTGLATLLLARRGQAVTHVDASRTAIAWARRNAELSGLAGAPIRWIVEDAEAFVRRELRRGRRYGAVLLDPPSYGHGPDGEPWRFEDGFVPLTAACRQLLVDGGVLLATTHTPGFGAGALSSSVQAACGGSPVDGGPLELKAESGNVLPLGAWARTVRG